MAKTNEVAEAQTTAVGSVLDFAADAGRGLEGADAQSFAIPFLTLLQANSPQCEPVKDGGIEGAKAGLFINSITHELYENVHVIPCSYQRRFIRWAPRSSGGGYKGDYSPIEVESDSLAGLSQHNGQYLMDVPEGAPTNDKDGFPLFDRLSDTRNHFVLVQNAAGSWQPALVSLTSTQIKKSKRWMSLIQGVEMKDGKGKAFNPPSFSHIYKLTSAKEENAKGKWQGVIIELVGPVAESDVYVKAREFNAQVAAGAVKVDQPIDQETASTDDSKF
jgi:hypothetical protein